MTDRSAELTTAAESLGEGLGTIAGLVPWLADQVRADAAAGRFAAWGQSTVIDENIAAAVIPRAVFDELHDLAGLQADWPIGNAGLLHVYGYLLSTVQTPYGLKRERWTEGALATALGLDAAAFLPWRESPTTLERVTAAALPILVAPVEPVLWLDDRAPGGARVRTVVLPGVLIYGIDDRLVTIFPLDTTVEGWRGAILSGRPRLRYNAVIEGMRPGADLESRVVRSL
ncbi:MAG: amino acid deaminase [Rhodoglobus sp.]